MARRSPSTRVAGQPTEVVLAADGLAAALGHNLGIPDAISVVRELRGAGGLLDDDAVAWLGRHLARTKLGLALGAGGAKGYAHVGVLQVLEEAGYRVDCVSGSSIGAVVGTWIALGLDAAAARGDHAGDVHRRRPSRRPSRSRSRASPPASTR